MHKPKYKIGDSVWVKGQYYENEIENIIIESITKMRVGTWANEIGKYKIQWKLDL